MPISLRQTHYPKKIPEISNFNYATPNTGNSFVDNYGQTTTFPDEMVGDPPNVKNYMHQHIHDALKNYKEQVASRFNVPKIPVLSLFYTHTSQYAENQNRTDKVKEIENLIKQYDDCLNAPAYRNGYNERSDKFSVYDGNIMNDNEFLNKIKAIRNEIAVDHEKNSGLKILGVGVTNSSLVTELDKAIFQCEYGKNSRFINKYSSGHHLDF